MKLMRYELHLLLGYFIIFTGTHVEAETLPENQLPTAQPDQSSDSEVPLPDTDVPTSSNEAVRSIHQAGPWAVAWGLSSPDFISAELFYRLDSLWELRTIVSLPVPLTINAIAPEDEESIRTRLKAATPETAYKVKGGYDFAVSPELRRYWDEQSGFYVSTGLGIRAVSAQASGLSDLYVCLVVAEQPCHAGVSFAHDTKLDMDVSIHSWAGVFRASVGYRWSWDHWFIDWNILGLAVPFAHQRRYQIEARLVTPDVAEEAEGILSDVDTYIDRKKDSIERRVVHNFERFDQLILPVTGLSVGYRF